MKRHLLIFFAVLISAALAPTLIERPQSPPAEESRIEKVKFSQLLLDTIKPGMSRKEIESRGPHGVQVTYHPETWIARDVEGAKLYRGKSLLLVRGASPRQAREALGPPDEERYFWSKQHGPGYHWFYFQENLELSFFGGRSSSLPGTKLYLFELKWPAREPITSTSPIFKGKTYR